jgi:hypothetical protein
MPEEVMEADEVVEALAVEPTDSFEADALPSLEADLPAFEPEVPAFEAVATDMLTEEVTAFEETSLTSDEEVETFVAEVDEPVLEAYLESSSSEVFQEPTLDNVESNFVTEAAEEQPFEVAEVAEVVAPVATVLGVETLTQQPEAQTVTPEEPVVTPAPSIPVLPSALPLVSYGILLRRHVDLSTLVQAQHAIAEEMGQEEPVSVTSFLLRAAAKAQHRVPLASGQGVGLAVIRDQGVSVVAVPEASSAPFRSVLAQSQQAMTSQARDSVDLVVADMSNFDIDEAVLNVGVPLLTLGRTMYDSSKGTHHSTLSLSGNVSVESGTKFLSAVAELLNAPIRLVV